MESSGAQKLSAAIFCIQHPPEACGFRGRQKTASLNFCAPCRIFRHFPSTDNHNNFQFVSNHVFIIYSMRLFIKTDLNKLFFFITMLIAPGLAVSADLDAQKLQTGTPLAASNDNQIIEMQGKACDRCLEVLSKLKNNEQRIWEICDFCLILTELGTKHQYAPNKIRLVKNKLLLLLKLNFKALSEETADKESIRLLNNIIAILEYLKKNNAKFSLANLVELQTLSKNITIYKKKRSIIEAEIR